MGLLRFAKSPRVEMPALLQAARGKPCLLQVPQVCNGGGECTVAAHSNGHDKGMGRKASDPYSVWACHACHAWLDTGKASRDEKRARFDWAHERQTRLWTMLSKGQGVLVGSHFVDTPPKERSAYQAALAFLSKAQAG